MDKRVIKLIIDKCSYKESLGIESLYDSDITDIYESALDMGIYVHRKEIEKFLENLV